MATAKDVAAQQLGSLDLSYLDKEKNVATDVYNTGKSSLETSYQNLLDQLSKNRAGTKTDFTKGRATVSESAYDMDRANKANLASRGVGKSGLVELGQVGNRIETGRQYSDIANKYYDTMSDLDTTEKTGTQNYNTDLKGLLNTYNQNIANIDTRRGEATNNYNITLANLAESIQSRWDAEANAQASLAAQIEANANTGRSNAYNSAYNILTGIGKDKYGDAYNAVKLATGNILSDAEIKQILKDNGYNQSLYSSFYPSGKTVSGSGSKKTYTTKGITQYSNPITYR